MGDCQPNTIFILPDPQMCGAANIQSVSSEAGLCTPIVVVDENNCGDLVPTLTGVPLDPAQAAVQLRVQESGDLDGAGFLWRFVGDTLWRGSDDGRRWHRSWAPFTAPSHPDVEGGNSAVYCEVEKTIILAAVDTGASPHEVVLRMREVDDDYDDWTETSFDPAVAAPGAPELLTPSATLQARTAFAYLPNGWLLFAYLYDEGGDPAIALIKSTDCGVSWSFVAKKLLTKVSETHKFRMTVSGQWIRITAINDSGEFMHTSSDNKGLSWSPETLDPEIVGTGGGPVNDDLPFDVAGIGGGIFVIAFAGTLGVVGWRLGQANGAEPFINIGLTGDPTKIGRAVPGPGDIRGIGATVAHERMYVLVSYADESPGPANVDDDQIGLYYQDLSKVLGPNGPGAGGDPDDPGPDDWQIVEPMTNYRGSRFLPTRVDLLHLGPYFFVYGGGYDIVDDDERQFRMLGQISGYSVQSYGNIPPGSNLTTSLDLDTLPLFYEVMWQAISGRPAGGVVGPGGATHPDTEWTEFSAGAPTATFTPAEYNISTGVGDSLYYEWNDPNFSPAAGISWVQHGSTVGAILRINSGSSQSATQHGIRITSAIDATDEVEFMLRMDTTGITVRDLQAGADVGSIAIDLTDYCEIRCRFSEEAGPTYTGTLVGFRLDDYFADPVISDDFTLSTAAGAPVEDEIRWGSVGAGAGDSDWREVWLSRFVDRDKEIGFNPDCMIGIAARLERTLLGNCLYVSWGGGAGAAGDQFTSEECHLHPAEAIFEDACSVDWRTEIESPLPAAELILVADPDNNTKRFVHDAIVLCGIEDKDVLVDYDNDPGFGSPTPATVVDACSYAGLAVTAQNGHAIEFTLPTAIGRPPISGELAGQRLRFTSGALAGQTFCILTHCDNVLQLDLPDGFVGPIGIGDAFTTFPTWAYAKHDATRTGRYMRLRFNDPDTCTGDHRLGAILAGCLVETPFPLEWTWTDAETSDVTVFDGANVSWAYELGRPRRTWVGRIVNDNVRWRQSMRFLTRTLAQYQVHPMAVVLDTEYSQTLIRGRWQPTDHENSFWWDRQTVVGPYRDPGGDQRLSIVEVP